MSAWYERHLGLPIQAWGGAVLPWKEPGMTVWNLFPSDADYFPGPAMINYVVEDLDALLTVLRAEGCDVDPKMEESEFGKFGWVTDPEGNRVELWQPPS